MGRKRKDVENIVEKPVENSDAEVESSILNEMDEIGSGEMPEGVESAASLEEEKEEE